MIKPYEILNATQTLGRPLRLSIYTENGLGSGGFLFGYDSDGAEVDGMNVYVRLWGKYINPFGPFKKGALAELCQGYQINTNLFCRHLWHFLP